MRTIAVDGVGLATMDHGVATSDSRRESTHGSRRVVVADDDGLRVMLARAEVVARDHGLTHRESEVLFELVRCDSYEEIADELGIARSTVCTHAKKVFEKTGASSRHALTLLVAFGIKPVRKSREDESREDARSQRSREREGPRRVGAVGASSRRGVRSPTRVPR